MFPTRKIWSALSLALIGVLVLTACGPGATPQVIRETQVVVETQVVKETQIVEQEVVITATPEPFKPEGRLTVGLTTDIAAIEVPYAPERQAANASWTLYDALAFPTADGKYEPALAESWELSDDGTTFTFHLRQGVTFHNGEPFNADAVVYSWQVYSQPEVTYANEWTTAKSVEKVDDYTVKISSEKPNALLLPRISGWSMIPPLAHAEMGKEAFAQSPIGTGPFMFKEWTKGDHLTVVANPNYWREGYPKVAEIVFKFMSEAATRVAAVQTGEIDVAPRLTSEDAQGLLGVPGVQIVRYPVNRVYYLAFNNLTTGKDTPIADPKVRQALAYAIDMDAIIQSLFNGYATRAVGFVGPSDLGFDGAEPVPYDPEKAKQLLTEAGYPNGFSVDMACPEAAYSHINEVCQAISGFLNDVGVQNTLELQEANAYWEEEANKTLPPLFVDSWSSTIPDSYGRLQGALGKDATYANWYDETLGALIDQVAVTVDTDARAEVYKEIQKLMREDPPFVYLYYPEAFEAVTTRVQNYKPRSAENYFLWDVSVLDGQ
jgi:peptide/nickel transport system substrate-binding protein